MKLSRCPDGTTCQNAWRFEDDEIAVIVHTFCEQMWNERKLSYLFTSDDEHELVRRLLRADVAELKRQLAEVCHER